MRPSSLVTVIALSLALVMPVTVAQAQTGNLGKPPEQSADIIRGQASGGTQAPAQAAGAGVAKQAPAAAPTLRLQIGRNPDCLAKGNCTLDDIVATGASFANLLTTLAGALFLVAFIYGGFQYLTSFGDKGKVSAGKKAMTTASIGMVIIMGAWVIVNYVVSSITTAG
jgi:hypothetical protein